MQIKLQEEGNPVQILGAIIWPSFVFAGIASMLFFASFDPTEIGYFATFPLELSAIQGYSLGFGLFWLLGVANIFAALFLLKIIDFKLS